MTISMTHFMTQTRKSHDALHDALMTQDCSETGCGGPVCGLRHENPFVEGGFHDDKEPQPGPGPEQFHDALHDALMTQKATGPYGGKLVQAGICDEI